MFDPKRNEELLARFRYELRARPQGSAVLLRLCGEAVLVRSNKDMPAERYRLMCKVADRMYKPISKKRKKWLFIEKR